MTSPWFHPTNPGYHNGYYFKVENFVCFDPTNMIRQEGKGQFADIWIVGNNNRSSIYQKGYAYYNGFNNEARLTIYGDNNITAQYQDGVNNESDILINNAHFGKALTFQVGVCNDANILQHDGFYNMAGIDQFGACHIGNITQTGIMNEATINQYNGGN